MSYRMRSELHRLNTFHNWPKHIRISPLSLTSAGFYYLGQGDRVRCFSCSGTVMQWEEGDDPVLEHRKHFPQCQFLHNPRAAGNIIYGLDTNGDFDQNCSISNGYTQSDSTSNSQQQRLSSKQNMKYEINRLESLKSWPKRNIIDTDAIAKSGLYFTGHDDKLQCAFCNGSMINWAAGDMPALEHRKHFGDRCPFVKGNLTDNVPCGNSNRHNRADGAVGSTASDNVSTASSCSRKDNTPNNLSSDFDRLNIVVERPRNPGMASFDNRIQSFQSWPIGDLQDPRDLAEAGFYYNGQGDQVRCFFCQIGLNNWEGDDPWEEHNKWSPKCGYLRHTPMNEQKEATETFDNSLSIEEENKRLKKKKVPTATLR